MKNKKRFLKAVAALTMAAAMTGSVFAIAACKKDKNNDDDTKIETPITYTVTFDLNYETTNKTSQVTVNDGGKATKTDPTRTGYTFDGWYTAVTGGTKVDLSTYTVSGNVTLYAHWTEVSEGPGDPSGGGSGGESSGGGTGGSGGETDTSQTYLNFVEQAGNNLVYKNSFESAETVQVPYGAAAATSANGAKVYGTLNGSATAYVSGTSVNITGGELQINDTEELNTVFGHIALDEALATKKVNIHVEYKATVETNSWTQFFIYNSNGQEVLGLRTNSKTTLGYRISGGNPVGSAAYSANGLIVADISINLLNDEFTVKINGNDITDANNKTLGTNKGDIAELRFGTATGARSIMVANAAISAEEGTLAEVTAYYNAKVSAYNENFTDGSIYEAIKTAAATAYSTYTSASKTTSAEFETAYNAYVSAIVTALKTNGVAWVQSQYPASDYDDTKNEDKTAYDDAITELTTALADSSGSLTTIEDCQKVFEKAINAIQDLRKDDYFNKKDVKIVVHVNSQTVEITGKKVDDKITLDEIKEQIADKLTSLKVLGYYKEEAYSNTIDFGADGYVLAESEGTSAGDEVEINIYVKTRTLQECEGSWHYYVNDSTPTVSGDNQGSNTFEFSAGTSGNKADFKFSDKNIAITITLNVKTGQKITLDITGFTGSTNNAVTLAGEVQGDVTAVTGGELSIEFAASTSVDNPGKGQFVYTANSDGTVTFTFKRSGNTVRVISIDVTVESVTD